MRDFSLFLLKNSLSAKMKKGFTNSCNGNASTSTLNQRHNNLIVTSPDHHKPPTTTTLEDMILQLEFEEEMAKREKHHHLSNSNNNVQVQHGRMSCVSNSDILRSARNALNQYPRFSLDGRDAMYRSSFRNLDAYMPGRRSVTLEESFLSSKSRVCLPATLGGESVVWCKPGVVAKLMGLEAMPLPLINKKLDAKIKRHNLRTRAQRHEMETRLAMVMDMNMNNNNSDGSRMRRRMGSCSKTGYRFTKPVAVEPLNDH
ncbi:hypothetical protein Ddye_023332 [Dipteronia dyeriana]|uniref:DUF3741 domain-containing protein n=1 Tax=Dipteronia dyeriana TaxID=168575 RepID=A0AAD9TTQ6_9ROSI|nr:hypothetical protein Ddye_023332 [Dipteronia dyeriana]